MKILLPTDQILKLYKQGFSAVQIAEKFGVSHNTAWRRLMELRIQPKNGGYYSGGQFKKGNIPWSKGKDNKITLRCEKCGERYKVYPYRTNMSRYCSEICREWSKGHKPWNTGRQHSKESLEKMRLTKLGKKPSEETKKKQSVNNARYWLGKKRSKETIEK